MREEPSRQTPGRSRAGEIAKCLPVFLRHPAFKIIVLSAILLAWSDPGKRAERLIAAAESGRLQTPGAWINLVSRIEQLPADLRKWTWARLRERLGAGPVRYLRQWRDRK